MRNLSCASVPAPNRRYDTPNGIVQQDFCDSAVQSGTCGGAPSGIAIAESHAFGFRADGGKDSDHDRDRAGDDRKRKGIIAAVMHGDARLQRGVDRRDQIAELIDEAREMSRARRRATIRSSAPG